MNKCKNCGNKSLGSITFITKTNFGHGDSSHITYVECEKCGNKSKQEQDLGIFEMKTFRKAQDNWNNENEQI